MSKQSVGYVFWITGFAGAGKSTIAREVCSALREHQANVVLLDGDAIRELLGNVLTHSPEDRIKNAWLIAKLAHFLSDQGIDTVVATVSLYKEVRGWLRKQAPKYREIYIKVDQATLFSRDQKGLYSGAKSGKVQNVAGVNLSVDEPTTPDLIIKNDEQCSNFEAVVQQILALRTND